jgi:hypothetical protein
MLLDSQFTLKIEAAGCCDGWHSSIKLHRNTSQKTAASELHIVGCLAKLCLSVLNNYRVRQKNLTIFKLE